jgi:peptidoglycan-associated lipoprotein
MRDTAKVFSVLLGVLFALTLTGCPKKCVEPVEPIAPPPPPEEISELPVELEAPPAEVGGLQPIYFDFDKSELRDDAAARLAGNAAAIKAMAANPMVSVEGHCDPVGTSEYNMALGLRRAEAAKAHLVKLGVDAARLSTMSYGEERLATQVEAEYELNRRAEFKVAQ